MIIPAVVTVSLLNAVLAETPDMAMHTCLTLDPYVSTLPQTSPSPYVLKSSKTGVITNQDSIIFTIKSNEPRVEFQDFIVQARDYESGVAVGMFVDTGDADIRMVNCFARPENTAVEFDSEPKREARMRWMPDYDYEGNVTFIATIVQTKDVYWVRQRADTLRVYNPW